jgi:hypothetical protein
MNFGPPSAPPPGHGPPGQSPFAQGGMPPYGPPNPMMGGPNPMGNSPMGPPGGPSFPANTGALVAQDTTGSYEGASFRIDHRDSNSVLRLTLQAGYTVKGKPGSMVCMAGTVGIQGSMKISLTKLMLGGDMTESKFTGPGEVVLAPEIWGDIVPISVRTVVMP